MTKSCVVAREDAAPLWSWGHAGWTLGSKYNQASMITGSLDSWPLGNKKATKKSTGLLIRTTLACLSHLWQKSFLTYMEGHTSAGGCTSSRQRYVPSFLRLVKCTWWKSFSQQLLHLYINAGCNSSSAVIKLHRLHLHPSNLLTRQSADTRLEK